MIFTHVIDLIKESRFNALKSVNKELIDLYWKIGEYISKRIESSDWGQSIVDQLAEFLQRSEPNLKGFSNKNLWRMRQFYDVYKDSPKLSPLVREISWTNNLIIFSRAKTEEEKEFYLKLCIQEKYGKRELERQISTSIYERVMIGKANLSPAVREINIDLLFFHRGLQCLVAFELKADKFKPEHLGQLNFYLEALDRDVKKQKRWLLNIKLSYQIRKYYKESCINYLMKVVDLCKKLN